MLIRDAFAYQEGKDAKANSMQRVVPDMHAKNDCAKAWLAGYDGLDHPAMNALVPMHMGGTDMTAAEYLESYDQWGNRRK